MPDLLDLTALEAHEAMVAGDLGAAELTAAWREAAAGDELNAYLWREEGGEESRAISVERDCIAPVAVKDIFCTEGVPTTAGSRILEGYRPPYTATAVRKLLEAGAPVLGKTNMDEFAMGSSNENSAYGPVLNPWDRGRVPGGSSVGFDGGVSLPDREDLSGLRFGVPRELAGYELDGGVRAVFEQTLRKIEDLAGEIAEVSLPSSEHGISAYYVIAPAEASSNLARYDGVRYGMRAGGDGDLVQMYETTRSEGFGPEVKRRIMLGTYALSSGYYEAYYGQAQKVRTRIAEDFEAAFSGVDLVVTPTSPSVAFGLGEMTDDPLAMYMNDFFTVPMSLAGIPAISIPAGLAEPEGGGPQLPVGFQIAAPAFAEQRLLDAAYALEQGIGFDARPGGADG